MSGVGVALYQAVRRLEQSRSKVAPSFNPSEVLNEALNMDWIPTLVDAHPLPTVTPMEALDLETLYPDDEPVLEPTAEAKRDDQQCLGRYVVRRELARGGMGRVIEAYDPELRRIVAIKVLLNASRVSENRLARFIAEAQITSQLEHPAIVPVHDFGITRDGTLYYVMKRVSGSSLREVLDALSAGDEATQREWSQHKLLAAFLRVCEAVAYAHACGVLHRDLKPDNIMLGAFGEVLVLDWGVARLMGDPTEVVSRREIERVSMAQTQDGAFIGTPGYMSPEQIQGSTSELDGRSDLWSLGAILYELLTLEHAYRGDNLLDLVFSVMSNPPQDPRERVPHLGIREDIAGVCLRALETQKDARFESVEALANEVQAFLEGSRRRERALELVAQALPMETEAAVMQEHAAQLRAEASEKLRDVPSYAPIEEKLPAWTLETEATRLEQAAEHKTLEFRQTLLSAINHAPDLAEPHNHLAANYRALHSRAEQARNPRSASIYETMLRFYDQGHHADYLAGRGAVSLVTEPAGAEVVLFRYEVGERRLQAQRMGVLGKTPLRAVELEMGSYLLEIRAEGHETVRYPVQIRRHEHWQGVPPGVSSPAPVSLPRLGELGTDACYVPSGPFWAGGDPDASHSFERRRYWLDGFVMKRFPVTNAEYMRFLNALVKEGRAEEALRHVPRERGGTLDGQGAMIYGRDPHGCFIFKQDADGDAWLPEYPVLMVNWNAALAYAHWLGGVEGKTWRLPFELEWEKAARGVDERFFPWGDHLDPSWLCMRDSHNGRPLPAVVDSNPVDVSPYGVRGLGGNAMDWCADLFERAAPVSEHLCYPDEPPVPPENGGNGSIYRVQRGGSWGHTAAYCRAAKRVHFEPSRRDFSVGIRLVRRFRTVETPAYRT